MLVALPTNTGAAKRNNIVVKLVKTPFILLMNSDTFIQDETIVDCPNHMNAKKIKLLS